jgi:hypothetical protein
VREIARKAEPLWRRRLVTAAFDGACWTAALTAAGWLRYEFYVAQIDFVGLTLTIVIALAAVWLFGAGTHLYFDRHAKGRLDEALGLTRVMALVSAAVFSFTLLGFAPSIPRSVPLIAALLALAMAVAGRLTRARHPQRDPGTVIFARLGRILPRLPDERRVRHRRLSPEQLPARFIESNSRRGATIHHSCCPSTARKVLLHCLRVLDVMNIVPYCPIRGYSL